MNYFFFEKPDLPSLKVFGCLAYATTLTAHRKKLDKRARKCVFLGYKLHTKGSILYDINSRELFLSRNVQFYEKVFSFEKNSDSTPQGHVHAHSQHIDNTNLFSPIYDEHKNHSNQIF